MIRVIAFDQILNNRARLPQRDAVIQIGVLNGR